MLIALLYSSQVHRSGRATVPAFVKPPPRRDSLDSFYSDDASTRDSAICLDHKAPSLSARSAGSSTFLGEAEDTLPSPVAPPVPPMPPLEHIDLPKPEAAYIPRSSQDDVEDVLTSTTAGHNMV